MSLRSKTLAAKVLAVFLIMGLAGIGVRSAAAGVAVSPLKQEISLKPGEIGKVVLTLAYNNRLPTDATQKLKLAVVDVQAVDEGSLVFKDPGLLKNSASRWVTLDAGDAMLDPGDSRPVECLIAVPESAAPGEYYAAVMVTLGTPGRTDKGVLVQYRIASGIFVTVLGRTFPKQARIGRCELIWPSAAPAAPEPAATSPVAAPDTPPAEASQELPRVRVLLENIGQARFDGSGRLTVLDDQKRIALVSPMVSRRPCVFGGDSRIFEAEITKALAAGKYTMRVEMDYQSTWAKARQDLRVEILPEQAAMLAQLRQRQGDQKSLLEATPGSLAALVPSGATRSLAVTLKNMSDADVACKVAVGGAGASVVTIRPEQFTIAKGGRKTVEVRVESTAGADSGPLSALLSVEASQEGGGHSELSIPVDIQSQMER
jgi:hypothetical protein